MFLLHVGFRHRYYGLSTALHPDGLTGAAKWVVLYWEEMRKGLQLIGDPGQSDVFDFEGTYVCS
jgi:hypothetical protein